MKFLYRERTPNVPREGAAKKLGQKLRDVLWAWAHPATPQHVGMFAGSLLDSDSWEQHKSRH